MNMKLIKLTESDIALIVKKLLEQEERVFEGNSNKFRELLYDYVNGHGKFLNRLYDKFIIKWDLSLLRKSVISLPDNLTVKGHLDLRFTPIKSLPNNLMVEEDLYLFDTEITYLPDDLTVLGCIFIGQTPIARNHELLLKYNKKYKICNI